ncbi:MULTISPECIES: GOLPH3/VPS74 family protein [Streptomyces]|uniref:GOLPH3/VPS74 family protein n=1 Tax=Streptomyces TaxID=1883 RepID=UPI0004CB3DD0|nr:GPP34 family phosphoprotein [Streptomyces sp. NRRL S-1868]
MDLTLGEQLLLLTLDADSGRFRHQLQTEYAASAAALLELALADRIRLEGDRVLVRDAAPLGVPGLDGPLEQLAQQGEKDDLHRWIFALRRPAFDPALRTLADKGALREERKGALRRTRYELLAGETVAATRERLAAVATRGEEPDERTACLVVLIHHGGLWETVLPDADQEALARRVTEITQGHWAHPALQQITDSIVTTLSSFASTTTATIIVNS